MQHVHACGNDDIALLDAIGKQDGVVVKTVPLTSGIFIWVVPRNLPKDTYEFVATYDPADDNNVSGVDSNGIFIQVR